MKEIERLYVYMEKKNLKPYFVEKEMGLSNGYLSIQKKRCADMGEGVINKIIDYFRDISPEWLLTGTGSMLRSAQTENQSPELAESSIYLLYKEMEARDGRLLEENSSLRNELRR